MSGGLIIGTGWNHVEVFAIAEDDSRMSAGAAYAVVNSTR